MIASTAGFNNSTSDQATVIRITNFPRNGVERNQQDAYTVSRAKGSELIKLKIMHNHIVFDFDETLGNTKEYNTHCIVTNLKRYKADLDEADAAREYKTKDGCTISDDYLRLCKFYNIDADIDDLLKVDHQLQTEGIENLKVFDYVPELLDYLISKGKTLHICTNRHTVLVNKILVHHNLTSKFANVVSCSDEGYKKPDPTCLINLINKIKADRKEIIYFGDSQIDYQFAKNAGIEAIIIDQYLNNNSFFKNLVMLFSE